MASPRILALVEASSYKILEQVVCKPSALGRYQQLGFRDALQEFRIETSSFAAGVWKDTGRAK